MSDHEGEGSIHNREEEAGAEAAAPITVNVTTNVPLLTPEKFNFKNPDGWQKWKRRFEQFLSASGLSSKEDERKASTLLYCLGEEAENVLTSTNITEAQRKSYSLPWMFIDPLYQLPSAILYLTPSTPSPIQGFGQHNTWSLLGMFGQESTKTSGSGLSRAFTAREPKSKGTPSHHSQPDVRFDQFHIDLVDPLPPSQGFTHILTCIDRFTWWPEAIPISDITAESVAQAFVRGWIARFGVPSTITTDRGRQFESALWSNLMQLLGSKRIHILFHRQLKASLKCHLNPSHWTKALPMVLLGIRTGSPAHQELVYGTTLRLHSWSSQLRYQTQNRKPYNFLHICICQTRYSQEATATSLRWTLQSLTT